MIVEINIEKAGLEVPGISLIRILTRHVDGWGPGKMIEGGGSAEDLIDVRWESTDFTKRCIHKNPTRTGLSYSPAL